MSVEVLRNVLVNDVLSVSACSVWLANKDIWVDSSHVPAYAYLCLKDIWTPQTLASSDYARKIVTHLGEGREAMEGDITLYPNVYRSVEVTKYPEYSNYPGAETAQIHIGFKLPEASGGWQKMRMAMLRVRYLLDGTWRATRKAKAWHDNTVDDAIESKVWCDWIEDPVSIKAREGHSEFRTFYVISVPKG